MLRSQAQVVSSVASLGRCRRGGGNGPATAEVGVGAVGVSGAASAGQRFTVSVVDIAPVVSVAAPASVRLGSPLVVDLNYADAGGDVISHWMIDWGDGRTEQVAGTATQPQQLSERPTAGPPVRRMPLHAASASEAGSLSV